MKRRIDNYTFVKGGAGAGTVAFDDITTIKLEAVLLITNVAVNVIIYNFADPTKGGAVATNVLTLDFDTSAQASTDKLQIFYDEGDAFHDEVDIGAPTKMGGIAKATAPTAVADGDRVNAWLGPDGSQRVSQPTAADFQVEVRGDIADNQPDTSSKPVKVGMHALSHGANPGAVGGNERVDWHANVHGIPWVLGGHPNIKTAEYNTTNSSGETNDDMLGAIDASTKLVITAIDVTCDKANTKDTGVRIGFGQTVVPAEGSSGATAVDGIVLSHPGIAAGSGMVKGTGAGIVGIGGANEELRITNEDPGGKLRVVVTFFTIAS